MCLVSSEKLVGNYRENSNYSENERNKGHKSLQSYIFYSWIFSQCKKCRSESKTKSMREAGWAWVLVALLLFFFRGGHDWRWNEDKGDVRHFNPFNNSRGHGSCSSSSGSNNLFAWRWNMWPQIWKIFARAYPHMYIYVEHIFAVESAATGAGARVCGVRIHPGCSAVC